MLMINEGRTFGISILLLVGIAIIALSLYVGTNGKPTDALRSLFLPRMTASDKKTGGSLGALRPFGLDDHVLGSNLSPITLITYGDTECPFTKEFFGVMQQIMSEYGGGSVTWIYRHFPNESLHPRAQAEAEAAECAGRVGGKMKFWEYLQAIFASTQSHNTLDPNALMTIAKNLGIPLQEFEQCRASRMFATRVLNDAKNARVIGSQGTPTTVVIPVEGPPSRIDGFASYEEMKSIIEQILFTMNNN